VVQTNRETLKKIKLILILFALGAIGGTLGDLSHVLTGTTGYPQDFYWWYLPYGLPFWVPLLFGSLTVILGGTHIQMTLGTKSDLGSFQWRFSGSFACLGLYLVSGFLPWPAGHLSDLVLGLVSFFIWWTWDRSLLGLGGGVVAAILGTSFEIILVHKQIFYYQPHAANLFGVPSWLPWLYFAAPGTIGNLAVKISQKIE